jgi:hypothetical protein
MVHGTGSFGGGGSGGGFGGGGGGFYFTSAAVNSLPHTSGGGRKVDCDCSWIYFCFCCRAKSFPVRILTLWTWIAAIVLTTYLITMFTVNETQTIDATITDMRKVPGSFSGIFCEGVSLTSHSSQFTAWLTDGEPPVNDMYSQEVTFRKETKIPYKHYEYWGFYLLSNSVIQISVCPDRDELNIFRSFKVEKIFRSSKMISVSTIVQYSLNLHRVFLGHLVHSNITSPLTINTT